MPRRTPLYRTARRYVQAGLSVIPIGTDGAKRPAFDVLEPVWDGQSGRVRYPWKPYQSRRPTAAELRSWFDRPDEHGIAVVAGAVSGNLEVIDCDNRAVAQHWKARVKERRPGLLARLAKVKTPRPGLHCYYRCPVIGGNQKLARVPYRDPEDGQMKPKTVIETKGEKGYCLAPGSPAACHRTGRTYEFHGDRTFDDIQIITPEEREILLACARELDEWQALHPAPPRVPRIRPLPSGSLRPGDDYAARTDWAEILEPHGWRYVGPGGDQTELWCRPGKGDGSSATTNYKGSDLLYVFSANAHPFEEGTGYTKFAAYTLLNHDGDFRFAASALQFRGYGSLSGPDADPRLAAFAAIRRRRRPTRG